MTSFVPLCYLLNFDILAASSFLYLSFQPLVALPFPNFSFPFTLLFYAAVGFPVPVFYGFPSSCRNFFSSFPFHCFFVHFHASSPFYLFLLSLLIVSTPSYFTSSLLWISPFLTLLSSELAAFVSYAFEF